MLELTNLTRTFGPTRAVDGISLQVATGESLALLGPSGCGKTTLLRLIAGLEQPDQGRIVLDGEDLTSLPPHRRRIGLMFQDYALFPHLDVFGNVAYGLRHGSREQAASLAKRVAEMLELVGMTGYERRRVFELSGGERQRVALARTLAPAPRMLMLDEPLAALDRAMREHLQQELRAIVRAVGLTTIYVTHDQSEAFALADRIALLRTGKIIQLDRPEALFRQPADSWVASFLGLGTIIPATLRSAQRFATPLGELELPGEYDPLNAAFSVLIRPDAVQFSHSEGLPVRVVDCQFRAGRYRVILAYKTTQLEAWSEQPVTLGATVYVQLPPQQLQVLAALPIRS